MKKIKDSLFLRLFLIFGATFLLLSLAIGFSFRLISGGKHRDHIHKNMNEYAKYLSKEIGNPPNLEKAKDIKKRLGIDTIIPSLNPPFQTTPGFLDEYRSKCLEKKPHISCFRYKKTFNTGIEIIFTHKKIWAGQLEQFPAILGLALILILIIVTISYQFVRRTFSPVQDMIKVAKGFSEGQWEHRVVARRQDELGLLANTLNSMADKIQRYLRSAKELQIAVSHELRSPLARMKVACEFIPDEKVRESLSEEIVLLDRMTSNLLERDRLEEKPELLKKVETDMGDFAAMICEPFGQRVQQKIQSGLTLLIDQDRMTLCLRNLIDNALKYSDNEVFFALSKVGNEVRIEVSDTGVGISKEDLEHVMDPFFRGDASRTGNRNQGGFGFGLSLCQTVIKAHDGKIGIVSELGKGTCVTITFITA